MRIPRSYAARQIRRASDSPPAGRHVRLQDVGGASRIHGSKAGRQLGCGAFWDHLSVYRSFPNQNRPNDDVGPNESWHKRCQQAVRVLVCMSYSDLAVGERSFKESLDSSRKIWRIVHYEESKHVPPEASSPVMVAASILKISRASGLPDS